MKSVLESCILPSDSILASNAAAIQVTQKNVTDIL